MQSIPFWGYPGRNRYETKLITASLPGFIHLVLILLITSPKIHLCDSRSFTPLAISPCKNNSEWYRLFHQSCDKTEVLQHVKQVEWVELHMDEGSPQPVWHYLI